MTLSPGDGTDTVGRNDMKNKTWRIARNSSWKLNEMVHEEIMSNLEDCVFHDFENTLHYVPELEQLLKTEAVRRVTDDSSAVRDPWADPACDYHALVSGGGRVVLRRLRLQSCICRHRAADGFDGL